MLKLMTLYSGSSGNCTAVYDGETLILIDAGKSARYTENALRLHGLSMADAAAVFITHEHCDHIGGVEMLAKKYLVPVHCTIQSAKRFIRPDSFTEAAAEVHAPLYTVEIGTFTVTSFVAEHDSAMNVGYTIACADGSRAGVVTDLGCVTDSVVDALSGCASVAIESNHDLKMLKNGSYPRELKQRILSRRGHLSNDDCASLALRLADSGTESITLAHLSRDNNRPDIAYAATAEVLCRGGFPEVKVCVAPAECVPLTVKCRGV